MGSGSASRLTCREGETDGFPVHLPHPTKSRRSWLRRHNSAKRTSKPSGPLEISAERFNSSVGQLTSNSIDGLQALVSELQRMQQFLNSEVDKVQRQIDSALAGINIIVETIGPWKSIAGSQTLPSDTRNVRAGGTSGQLVSNAASGSNGWGARLSAILLVQKSSGRSGRRDTNSRDVCRPRPPTSLNTRAGTGPGRSRLARSRTGGSRHHTPHQKP